VITLLRRKPRTLAYHPMTDDWRITPWDCYDPGPLTLAEARNVLKSHSQCGTECVIGRTARTILDQHGDLA
jgi:hypothetical protein